jgi:hypothetical protein
MFQSSLLSPLSGLTVMKITVAAAAAVVAVV